MIPASITLFQNLRRYIRSRWLGDVGGVGDVGDVGGKRDGRVVGDVGTQETKVRIEAKNIS